MRDHRDPMPTTADRAADVLPAVLPASIAATS